jgi:hypothetical protein
MAVADVAEVVHRAGYGPRGKDPEAALAIASHRRHVQGLDLVHPGAGAAAVLELQRPSVLEVDVGELLARDAEDGRDRPRWRPQLARGVRILEGVPGAGLRTRSPSPFTFSSVSAASASVRPCRQGAIFLLPLQMRQHIRPNISLPQSPAADIGHHLALYRRGLP